jgi:YHS domain-containing protein
MRTLTSLLAAGLLACSMSAIAADERGSDSAGANHGSVVRDGTANGEFGNECAWGLANDKHVKTDCKVNMTGENGKTYCFSSDKAMTAYMKNPSVNLSKASKFYGRA